MKKFTMLLWLMMVAFSSFAQPEPTDSEISDIWTKFRSAYPYGYQCVAQKHLNNSTVTIVSEPSPSVTKEQIAALAAKYNGNHTLYKQPFGYDGWLTDIVIVTPGIDETTESQFESELFTLLYATDYKKFCIDLDNPMDISPYLPQNINVSVSSTELNKWLLNSNLQFACYSDHSKKESANTLLCGRCENTGGELYASEDDRLILWLFDPKTFNPRSNAFQQKARMFSIDSDLILGAIGKLDAPFAVIGRARQVSLDEFPPLRSETIEILATAEDASLAQSYERYHVFGGKLSNQNDVAPIYLSEELWHTEYGNLLNVTDQMLKSWSENGKVEYIKFPYEKPYYWAFQTSALKDLKVKELTFNWNTAGAGYVTEHDGYSILAANRTGSLPVSYIPDGMEGKTSDAVVEAEELGYDFFSGLNNRELARVVQYATLYQIFQFYLPPSKDEVVMPKNVALEYLDKLANGPYKYDNDFRQAAERYRQPLSTAVGQVRVKQDGTTSSSVVKANYRLLEGKNYSSVKRNARYAKQEQVIENLLRAISDTTSVAYKTMYEAGRQRFIAKYMKDNFEELKSSCDDALFISYLQKLIKFCPSSNNSFEDANKAFSRYFNPNLSLVLDEINIYKSKYGSFPFNEAAHAIVNPRSYNAQNYSYTRKLLNFLHNYQEELKLLCIEDEDYIDKHINTYNEIVDNYNKNLNLKKIGVFEIELKIRGAKDKKKIQELQEGQATDLNRYTAIRNAFDDFAAKLLLAYSPLTSIASLSRSVGALHWLLTDPGEYDDVIGEYFADMCRNSEGWIKSPSIVHSYQGVNYGGHNLDSRVSRVIVDNNVPKGTYRIFEEGGRRVIKTSTTNVKDITPSVLRQIERTALTGSQKLTNTSIKPRSISCLDPTPARVYQTSVITESSQVKVFSEGPKLNAPTERIPKRAVVNDQTYTNLDMLLEDMYAGKVHGEVHIENFSENEVKVFLDDAQQCILQRSRQYDIDLSKYDINQMVTHQIAENGVCRIRIPEISPKHARESYLEFEIPTNQKIGFLNSLKRVFSMPKEKINNIFRFKRSLKKDLQEVEQMHIDNLQFDNVFLFSVIFFDYEFDFVSAA